ncbi:hypothetical protein [Thermosipho atlanticus]|uniref:hypothetical protein n=1 Tax=Thermosipho atlanticus TaxID=238991 RepID=UPI00093318FC|nr:hypothetical protein [Thermosipho atlanticus]
MFKNIEFYDGRGISKVYVYDPLNDGYSKKILITLKLHFITRWRNKEYFYYVLPSSSNWKNEHIKAFYAIGNEILRNYEKTKDSEFRVIHVPQNKIFKGIRIGSGWSREIRNTIKAFAIHVFDRLKAEDINDVMAQIEEFDGTDEFLDF